MTWHSAEEQRHRLVLGEAQSDTQDLRAIKNHQQLSEEMQACRKKKYGRHCTHTVFRGIEVLQSKEECKLQKHTKKKIKAAWSRARIEEEETIDIRIMMLMGWRKQKPWPLAITAAHLQKLSPLPKGKGWAKHSPEEQILGNMCISILNVSVLKLYSPVTVSFLFSQ